MQSWWFSFSKEEQIQFGVFVAVGLRMLAAWIHLAVYIKYKRQQTNNNDEIEQ